MLTDSQKREKITNALTLDKMERWVNIYYRDDHSVVTIIGSSWGQTFPTAVYLNWVFMNDKDFQGYFVQTKTEIVYVHDFSYYDVQVKMSAAIELFIDALCYITWIKEGAVITKS